jgi:hypothetical protein
MIVVLDLLNTNHRVSIEPECHKKSAIYGGGAT